MKNKFIFLVLCLCLLCSGCAGKETVVNVVPKTETMAGPSPSPQPVISIDGSWHGYWEIFECSGVWEELDKSRWDCWAEIKNGRMLIWDVDLPKEDGLCDLELKQEANGYTISKGRMMDVSPNFESWRISLESDAQGRRLVLRGQYDGNAEGKFNFAFYLRPDKKD